MDSVAILSHLRPGDRVVIDDIQADESVRRRLHAMGLLRGRQAQLIRRARFGGPLQVRVGSVDLILRRRDADSVHVTPLL
ncbi:MAG: FeoA domain-containing protein [Gammaproteobacteria bacterium]|nr:FeoA domain-containing protein [Gammaproteobacteria bacterium]